MMRYLLVRISLDTSGMVYMDFWCCAILCCVVLCGVVLYTFVLEDWFSVCFFIEKSLELGWFKVLSTFDVSMLSLI